MAYTFTLHDTPFAKDATFDSLYADSIEDFDSGTVIFGTGATDEYKIYRVYNMITQTGYGDDKFISISKDSATIMLIQGYIKNSTLVWNIAVTGKINNSKSWCATSEFYVDNKAWIQSQGCNAWEVHCIPDTRVDTFFVGVSDAGKTQGTFSRTIDEGQCKLRWEF